VKKIGLNEEYETDVRLISLSCRFSIEKNNIITQDVHVLNNDCYYLLVYTINLTIVILVLTVSPDENAYRNNNRFDLTSQSVDKFA